MSSSVNAIKDALSQCRVQWLLNNKSKPLLRFDVPERFIVFAHSAPTSVFVRVDDGIVAAFSSEEAVSVIVEDTAELEFDE